MAQYRKDESSQRFSLESYVYSTYVQRVLCCALSLSWALCRDPRAVKTERSQGRGEARKEGSGGGKDGVISSFLPSFLALCAAATAPPAAFCVDRRRCCCAVQQIWRDARASTLAPVTQLQTDCVFARRKQVSMSCHLSPYSAIAKIDLRRE